MAPEDERLILEQCARENIPVPKKIRDAPELQMGLQLYWIAFTDLNSCRQIGYSVAPIPWTAIREYAVANGFDEEQEEDLIYLMGCMDREYIKFTNRKSDVTSKTSRKTKQKS